MAFSNDSNIAIVDGVFRENNINIQNPNLPYSNGESKTIGYVYGSYGPTSIVGANDYISSFKTSQSLIDNLSSFPNNGRGTNPKVLLTDVNSASSGVPTWVNVTTPWSMPALDVIGMKRPTAPASLFLSKTPYAQLRVVAASTAGAAAYVDGVTYYNAGMSPSTANQFGANTVFRTEASVKFEMCLWNVTLNAIVAGTLTTVKAERNYMPNLSINTSSPTLLPGNIYQVRARKLLSEISGGSSANVFISEASIIVHVQ